MRIAVLVVRRCREQRARRAQVFADRAIRRVELRVDDAALPAEPAPVGAILPVALDREHRVDGVFESEVFGALAQLEIVLAMVGCHMDEAGALFGRDEIAGQERAGFRKEPAEMVHRVAGNSSGEVGAKNRINAAEIILCVRKPIPNVVMRPCVCCR